MIIYVGTYVYMQAFKHALTVLNKLYDLTNDNNANAVSLYEIDQATHKQKFLFTHKDDDSDILINLLKLNKIL